MDVLEGPLGALGLVLVVSGVFKLADTAPTEAMLGALKLPRSKWVVDAIGLFEIVVGVAIFVFGGRLLAVAVAVAFGTFSVISFVLVRRGERNVSCGCFGRSSATISPIHVAVDSVATGIALLAVVVGVPGFFDLAPDLPWYGGPQVAMIVVTAALTIAVLTVLPETLGAARRQPKQPAVREFALVVNEPTP